VAFVTSQARPPVAFHTLFAILSSSSVFELDSFTERISCPRCVRPLRGARLLRLEGQETRLSDVGKKMAFKLAELDLSPKTVEVTFEAAVPDLRTSMPDYVDSLSSVISEWPKVVGSVFILRSEVQQRVDEFSPRLDNTLAFLKGCVASPPMPGASMFDHGLDQFTAAEGVAGSIAVFKDNVAKILLNDSDIPGQVCLLESMLSDTGEFVGLIHDLASRLRALEISDPPVAGGVSGF